jgi:hypothetical protein
MSKKECCKNSPDLLGWKILILALAPLVCLALAHVLAYFLPS